MKNDLSWPKEKEEMGNLLYQMMQLVTTLQILLFEYKNGEKNKIEEIKSIFEEMQKISPTCADYAQKIRPDKSVESRVIYLFLTQTHFCQMEMLELGMIKEKDIN